MTLLLDTHVYLWWLGGDGSLPLVLHEAIERERGVTVSAASIWEIAIKRASGKLRAPDEVSDPAMHGLVPLAVDPEDAWAAGALPRHHADPFDRVLVAQARLRGLTIATTDPAFHAYDVRVLSG